MEPIDFETFVDKWNESQGQNTPALHREIARWLEARKNAGDRALLLLAFRGAGKSTLVGLFCAWLLRTYPFLRILVLAADHALARKMVRNVKRIIERHEDTQHLRPKNADEWASDRFTIERKCELRDPSMLAKGIGANVTGSRADVVICDDVEVPNTADTPAKRADLRERLDEIRYVLAPAGGVLYIGTPHVFDSIYAARPPAGGGDECPRLEGFSRLELPVFDGQGRSRWPERFPPERIEEIRRKSGANKFKSQMLLEPADPAAGRLDVEGLKRYDDELVYREAGGEAVLSVGGRRLVSASCWWDPSFGAPERGDRSVVAVVYTDEDGRRRLHAIRYIRHDPLLARANSGVSEATQMCRQVVDFADRHWLPAVRVESNGIGKLLPNALRQEMNAAGVRSAVIEETSRRAKEARILEAFDVALAAGGLYAHAGVWQTPFVAEMREWRPGESGRDDGLDAVAGCLLSEFKRLSRVPVAPARPADDDEADDAPPPRRDWRPTAQSYKAKTEFAV